MSGDPSAQPDDDSGEPCVGDAFVTLDSVPLVELLPGLDGFALLVDSDLRIHDLQPGKALAPPDGPGRDRGRPVHEVLVPEVADQLVPALDRVQVGESILVEFSLELAEGTRRFDTRVMGLSGGMRVALARDVTGHASIEATLYEREERLRAILLAETECVTVIDRDEGLVEINPAGLKMLEEPSLDAVRQRGFFSYVDPEHREAATAIFDQVIDGGQGSIELELIGRLGTRRWVDVNAVPLRNGVGEVTAVLAVSRDTTDRRQTEDALRKSERRLAEATEVGKIGIADHDLVADTIYWSPQMRALFGWDADGDEVVTVDKVAAQVPPEDVEAYVRDIERVRDPSGDGLDVSERRIIRRDTGEVRTISFRALTSFGGEGEDRHPVRTIGAAVDITERLELEQRLRHAERLDSIGRLAGGIAHDFNNMLTAILGFAQLIEEDSEAGRVDLRDLREISAAAERARDLTSQLLAFARRQANTPAPTDLNVVVRDTDRVLGRVLREDITIVTHLAEGLWFVLVDPSQIEQVVLNLVINARDALPSGGELRISTDNVVVDAAVGGVQGPLVSGDYVRLSVTDSGVGMSGETLSQIFEPFFTTKEVGLGTGLGLATVYGIVHQNGGEVAVRSELGAGTTFEVYLPRADVSDEGSRDDVVSAAGPSGVRGTERILLVEDDESVRSLAARSLRDAGYDVLSAASPSEAIGLAADERMSVDLLVTDVVMPQMSGRALADVLLAGRPRLRVLYMSGYAQDTIGHHGVIDADLDFLAKPFTPSRLRQRVREILDDPSR